MILSNRNSELEKLAEEQQRSSAVGDGISEGVVGSEKAPEPTPGSRLHGATRSSGCHRSLFGGLKRSAGASATPNH